MSELVVRDVVTGYDRVEILHGVTLTAKGGEVTCVFGPNGCGKSTLLKAIAGVVGVWSGSVHLDDADVTGLPSHRILRHGLALMPQGGGVFPQLSVRDNLRIGAYSVPSRDDRSERIDAVLEEYPRLRERLSVQAGNLSGGEQMMLAIARALVVRPRVVLFDEPSAGLSPRLAAEALGRAAELADRGVAVLMVEQNLREAMRVADRVHILAAGENRFSGTPTDIESDRQLMELYLGAAT